MASEGFGEDGLGPKSELLGLYNAQKLAGNAESVVGRAVVSGVLLDCTAIIRTEGPAWVIRHHMPASRL